MALSTTPEQARPTQGSLRRREAGVSQDEAMYACHCGFVFSALVSTTVDCPHCGGSQAW